MTQKFLLDTGPLVALLNRREDHHDWIAGLFSTLDRPVVTCEPVLTEACFLLRGSKGGPRSVLELVDRGILELPFELGAHHHGVRALMDRYVDVPMSLADACLVRMAELDPKAVVLTLDKDFKIYRKNGRQVVPVCMPD